MSCFSSRLTSRLSLSCLLAKGQRFLFGLVWFGLVSLKTSVRFSRVHRFGAWPVMAAYSAVCVRARACVRVCVRARVCVCVCVCVCVGLCQD